jgi:hypothetical protein
LVAYGCHTAPAPSADISAASVRSLSHMLAVALDVNLARSIRAAFSSSVRSRRKATSSVEGAVTSSDDLLIQDDMVIGKPMTTSDAKAERAATKPRSGRFRVQRARGHRALSNRRLPRQTFRQEHTGKVVRRVPRLRSFVYT